MSKPGTLHHHDKEHLEEKKLEAEIRKLDAETGQAETERDHRRLALTDARATLNQAREYLFMGAVDNENAASCMVTLGTWSRRDPREPITIVFNSPGGSVTAGFALFDFVEDLKGQGHYVTTVARGWVASMGGILMQCGSERVIGRNATMLIHELQDGCFGSLADFKDRAEWQELLMERIWGVMAERSTMSVQELTDKVHRKDWWLNAEQVVDYGFADRIG